MTELAIKMSVLALPLLLLFGPAEAATKKATNARAQMSEPYTRSEMGPEADAVRTKCWALAAQRRQSSDEFRATVSPQSVIYGDCVRKEGYLP